MLKETETEKTIGFFVPFLLLVAFQSEEARAPLPSWLRLCFAIWFFGGGGIANLIEIKKNLSQCNCTKCY